MDNKTNRIFSAGLITILSLLILTLAAPAMAENTTATDEKAIDGEHLKGSGVCEVLIGVDSAYSKYGQYSTITFSGWIKNQEWNYVDYDMTLTLQGPGGDSWDFDGRVYYYKKIKHTVHKNPPSGGWIPGTYTICNDVKATGTDCTYHDWSCRSFEIVPSPKPDLKITDIWYGNSTIYYRVTNRGDKKSGESNTSLTIDGVFEASDYVASLEPGRGRTESFDYAWACTDKSKIKVCADYMDAVKEGDEKNNCRTEAWVRKDLKITDIWTDNSTIYYKIKNAGYEKVGASNTSLTIDGVFTTSHYVGPLEPEEDRTESIIYTWTCTGGSDTIEVCADYKDDVEEGDEKNNCRDKTLICKDIAITNIWTDDSTIYYKIKNAGDEKVGASNTSLTIDGVFITSYYVGPLEPKEERTESIIYTWTCTGGSDTIEVCADYKDDVEEGDEKNNCRNVTWTCPPDISVSPASFDVRLPSDVVKSYTLTIRNIGGGTLEFSIGGIASQPGWPKTTGGAVGESSPALGDIDGDGDIEVVVGSFDRKVYAWHHDGSTITGWPKTTSGYITSSPALGDIDEDGDMEVVVGSADGDKKVYAWHHDGSNVSGWPKTTGYYVYSSPALGDIDGDGDIEVVVGSYDKKVYAWHHDGSTVSGWPKRTAGYWGSVTSSPALGDIDGDGDIEVVVGSGDKNVYAWHHDGSAVSGWPKTTGGSVHSSPALGDIDGDGDIEVVVGSNTNKAYAWHHDGSTVSGWPKTTGAGVWSSPALGDIDGDGGIEVVVGSGWRYSDCACDVYAWHHDGSAVSGWPKTTDKGVKSSPALGDIDGDGDIEVVVGSYDKKVYAWHHDGSAVSGWPKKTGGSVSSSPALGDIDGDGDIEVVVGSGGHVYVWDCSGIYNPNNIEWGMFHHNVRRTGLYEAKPPRKAGWLSGYVTNGILYSDSQKNITVTFNTSGLEFGEYHVNIDIASNDPDEPTMITPVRLTVTPLRKGDLNGDDNITSTDAAIALEIAAGSRSCDAVALVAADVSGDGSVTSIDVLMILQAAAGAISL